MVMMMLDCQHQYPDDPARLVQRIAEIGRCVIAYSGGVDSAVVAAAAQRADQSRLPAESLADHKPSVDGRSIAVTADSPSVSREQLETACRVASEIGMRHEILHTTEIERDDYRLNDRRRCFFCKQTLYAALSKFALSNGVTTVLSGTNADDLGDYRPGIDAGNQAGVVAPLAELGLTKARVRAVASHWGLSVAERPAQPCLSSRIAYGVAVTRERLQKVELAEHFLRCRGYSPLRIRLLENDFARIEVAVDSIDRLSEETEFIAVSNFLQSIGFQSISVDPRGFRTGSMNELVQLTNTRVSSTKYQP